MAERHLHIICLDVPYPVDYGGVFDLFYKIKALHQAGIRLHVHCFEYGRGQQPELEKYCEEVFYYDRIPPMQSMFGKLPYIVASRMNTLLLKRLQQDDFPILMEGIHCTGWLWLRKLDAARCTVRLHNVEHLYYQHLAMHTNRFWQKQFFLWESRRLKNYEKALANHTHFFTVSEDDLAYFEKQMGYETITYLPLFLKERTVSRFSGMGDYCLYQGNLSVAENRKAVEWLIREVFAHLELPFIVAGKNPDAGLVKLANRYAHIKLIANPNETTMQGLLQGAQINVLPSFNRTGIKLKLIQALYNSRYCLVNDAGADGTQLKTCCLVGNTPAELRRLIQQYMQQPVGEADYRNREQVLQRLFNNKNNGQHLIQHLFPA